MHLGKHSKLQKERAVNNLNESLKTFDTKEPSGKNRDVSRQRGKMQQVSTSLNRNPAATDKPKVSEKSKPSFS
jgi:hypothetical protein